MKKGGGEIEKDGKGKKRQRKENVIGEEKIGRKGDNFQILLFYLNPPSMGHAAKIKYNA